LLHIKRVREGVRERERERERESTLPPDSKIAKYYIILKKSLTKINP
jgi:hypothetical protein